MDTRRSFLARSLAFGAASVLPAAGLRAASTVSFASDPFKLGVASGYPTANSVVLWTRLAPSPLQPDGGMPQSIVPVHWEIAADDKMNSVIKRGTEYASPEWAHSIHAEPEGLDPGREYWYRFTAGNARSAIGRTRTAPEHGTSLARLKLAIASCQQYEHGYFTAYRHMVDDDLDLIIHVGDYIYEHSWGADRVRHHDSPEVYTLDDYRRRYALYKCDQDLAAAHAACPWLVTWDDHEVDNDYASAISEEDDAPELFLARRAAAYRAYYEHMPLPRRAVPFGPHMRLHAQRAFGDLVSLCMLDQRQYRSPHACPPAGRRGATRVSGCAELASESRTMLGEPQEAWLSAELSRSRARWNLLAQGTVMAYIDEQPGADKRFWSDGWNGYPAARKRLMNELAERKIANPVVLSGDIHAFVVSGLHQRADDPESPILASEFTTTSISSQALAQRTLDAWSRDNPNLLLANSEHRGYIRMDITHERVHADLIEMRTVTERNSTRRTLRSFVVENGRPGPTSV
jgi:alkaline phosphatase D